MHTGRAAMAGENRPHRPVCEPRSQDRPGLGDATHPKQDDPSTELVKSGLITHRTFAGHAAHEKRAAVLSQISLVLAWGGAITQTHDKAWSLIVAVTPASPANPTLLQEMHAAEREARAEALTRKLVFGFTALALVVVLGTVSWVAWKNHRETKLGELTLHMQAGDAFMQSKKPEEGLKEFQAAAMNASPLQPLALLRVAEAQEAIQQPVQALATLTRVSGMAEIDAAVRDIARLSAARLSTDAKEAQHLVAAAAEEGRPFAPLALQTQVALAMASADRPAAESALIRLGAMPNEKGDRLAARSRELQSIVAPNEAANHAVSGEAK